MENSLLNEKIFNYDDIDNDPAKNYATAAFRLYARCGKPTGDEVRDAIRAAALEREKRENLGIQSGFSSATEQAAINADNAERNATGRIKDIIAVNDALDIISSRPDGREIKKALEIVYFASPEERMRRGDISDRANQASLMIPTSERNVFRHLKTARDIFCFARELKV